ncbi:MAG: efflux RND transporter periplasmic adaptor subunit [Pseudomonadota bacterium]
MFVVFRLRPSDARTGAARSRAALAGTLAALGLTVALAAAPLSAQETGAAPTLRPVKTMTLAEGRGAYNRQFFGRVVARQTVDLAFQVGGQIVEFPVLEGERVPKGSLIAQLNLDPFERAMERAVVQRDEAQSDLERLQALQSNVARTQVEDADTALMLSEIEVRDAASNLQDATLRAPFDGMVAARQMANFTTVEAGTPVVRLHDISEWRVEIEVPEILFQRAGDDPNIELVARFPGIAGEIPLEVREFTAEASALGQSFTITLAMLREPGPGVLPGTSVTVDADLQILAPPVVLPPSAVVMGSGGETSVMVFEPDAGQEGAAALGSVRSVPVTLGSGPNGELTLEEGPDPGVQIVVAGAQGLRDGQAVRRFAGFPN